MLISDVSPVITQTAGTQLFFSVDLLETILVFYIIFMDLYPHTRY